mgnify:CR=1 FL=1
MYKVNIRLRKANAIIEYGVVIIIVTLFLIGINTYLRRHIEGRVRDESDRTLGHAIGLEWPQQTYTVGGSRASFDRVDEAGGIASRSSSRNDWSLTYTQPVGKKIMKHKRASRHVQDAARTPPSIDYPDLEYKGWQDIGWPI